MTDVRDRVTPTPQAPAGADRAVRVGAPAVHVEVSGAGRPLVLLHGFAMHGGLFATIVPAFSSTHRVVVPDLPGHGRSAPMIPLSLERAVVALDDALADEGGPLDVVGWSLGGALAMHWAATRPTRVRKLVLVATTPSFVARDGWPHAMADDTLRRFGDELRASYRLTLQRFLALQTHGSEGGRATLATLRRSLFAHGEPTPAALAATLALLRELDLRDAARAVRVPTRVIAGDRDTIARPQAAAWLAGALPHARLTVVAGAAHAPFLSHADAFVADVAAFLDAG